MLSNTEMRLHKHAFSLASMFCTHLHDQFYTFHAFISVLHQQIVIYLRSTYLFQFYTSKQSFICVPRIYFSSTPANSHLFAFLIFISVLHQQTVIYLRSSYLFQFFTSKQSFICVPHQFYSNQQSILYVQSLYFNFSPARAGHNYQEK